MLETQLEFEITQWLDGDLPDEKQAMLRRHLEQDPQAAKLMEEHQKLNDLLAKVPSLPQLDWEAMQTRISQAVGVNAKQQHAMRLPQWGQLAIAACALLALGLGMRLLIFRQSLPATAGQAVALVQISGPQAATVPANAIADVSIGPPASVAASYSPQSEQWADRPPQIMIAPGAQPAQDALLVALAR